jgi:acetyl-CoA carboxylase carboxyltransferase component
LRGDPDREAKAWLQKLSETERMRSNYQEMAARGLITFEELGEKLRHLDETRAAAQRELEALKGRRERVEQLERDKEEFLNYYAKMTPEALDSLAPEERHRVYKILQLRVSIFSDDHLEMSGVLIPDPEMCQPETISA